MHINPIEAVTTKMSLLSSDLSEETTKHVCMQLEMVWYTLLYLYYIYVLRGIWKLTPPP